jgi:hypothetical protein
MLLIIPACNGNTGNNVVAEDETPLTPEMVKMQEDPDWALIEKNLEIHLKAQADGDFEKFTQYAYPRLFELMNRQEVIDLMKKYRDEGMTQELKKHRMTYISPTVTDSIYNFKLIKFDGTMTINFKPDYGTDPKAFYNMLRDEHGEQYMSYNEEKKQYTIQKEFFMYATTPVDTTNWTFLNYSYVSAPNAGTIFHFDVVKQLKSFE